MSKRVKEYFEDVSSKWDEMRKTMYGEEVREAVLDAARIGEQDTVLDVGAGTGFLTEAAAKIAGKVIALDFSESMLQEALNKLPKGKVEFRVGTMEQIPLPDSSVDAVVGNMVLHHSVSPERAIREMSRVLRRAGRLVLSDMQEHQYEWLRTEMADVWLGFRLDQVEGFMKAAGLARVSVKPLSTCCSTDRDGSRIEIPMFLAQAEKLG